MPRLLPKIISEDDAIKLINGARNPRRRVAYALGFYAGLRSAEIAALKPEDCDNTRHIIHIIQGKGCKDRNIVLMKELIPAIKHLPIGVSTRMMRFWIAEDSEKLIGRRISMHTLRHSCASWLLNEKRWSAFQVQTFLGHSDVKTTQIYAHVYPEDLVKLVYG